MCVVTHGFIGRCGDVRGTHIESLCWRGETRGHSPRQPSLALPLWLLLSHITHDFCHLRLDAPPQKFLHTPRSGAPQKCFQSGPALAKTGPDIKRISLGNMGPENAVTIFLHILQSVLYLFIKFELRTLYIVSATTQ